MDEHIGIRSELSALLRQMERLFRYWAAAAVALGVAASLAALRSLPGRGTVDAVVEFDYAGIESGRDPAGARFDPGRICGEDVVREAVEAMGTAPEEEAVQRIRRALSIRGQVPDGTLGRAVDAHTIYDDRTVSGTIVVRDRSYWPARYTVTLDHASLGWDSGEGIRFLDALLDRYAESFYGTYGYAAALEDAVLALGEDDLDDLDALEMLDSCLISLGGYLSRLSQEDEARYVSEDTGRSLADLIEAVDAVRSDDIRRISARILEEGLMEDREGWIDRYACRIAGDERRLDSEQARSEMLGDLAAGCARSDLVVFGASGQSGEQSALPVYEFSRRSAMYDGLIREDLEARTTIAEIQERIGRWTEIRGRLEAMSSDGQTYGEVPESENGREEIQAALGALYGKVRDLLGEVRTTADGYLRTVRLQRAFQVVRAGRDGTASPLRKCVRAALAVEAVLFGAALLAALLQIPKRRAARDTDGIESREDRYRAEELRT